MEKVLNLCSSFRIDVQFCVQLTTQAKQTLDIIIKYSKYKEQMLLLLRAVVGSTKKFLFSKTILIFLALNQ